MPAPSPGQVVRVRQRQYLVEAVEPPAAPADATLVRLACLDDAQGRPLDALWELEPDAEVLSGAGWDRLAARGFDPPKLFSVCQDVRQRRWSAAERAGKTYPVFRYHQRPTLPSAETPPWPSSKT